MASSTAALARGLTWADPFTTRDTVPRPTPARTATSSRVGRPEALLRSVVIGGTSSARILVAPDTKYLAYAAQDMIDAGKAY
ncbi:hypothetical protein Adu01nite_63750 [Paractinoplanes durhamensis]|uniref:Uncharacterized protein n=1 Tax=Paractinoplanes durhamensis TaxID=113563 RepID=A0ABQ3Z5B4_9ACTN|nr:hypothetical protein Adu01nite_63750 [Actinoplanes durhamensis]